MVPQYAYQDLYLHPNFRYNKYHSFPHRKMYSEQSSESEEQYLNSL